jgi:DsbC/DsbD-like thiol-disulfide interchange protein
MLRATPGEIQLTSIPIKTKLYGPFTHLTSEFAHNLPMITTIASILFLSQGLQPAPEIHFKGVSAKKDVLKGSFTVTVPSGWHAYQNPPKSEFENPLKVEAVTKGLKFTKVTYPKGEAMKSAGVDSLVYVGEVTIPFQAKFDKTIKAGKNGLTKFEFKVSYQFCNDSTCIPPTTLNARVEIKVAK